MVRVIGTAATQVVRNNTGTEIPVIQNNIMLTPLLLTLEAIKQSIARYANIELPPPAPERPGVKNPYVVRGVTLITEEVYNITPRAALPAPAIKIDATEL